MPARLVLSGQPLSGIDSVKELAIRRAESQPRRQNISASGHDIRPLGPDAIERLAADLAPEERDVILRKGTERPFCGTLLDNKRDGLYACRLCGLPLFRSGAKFDSGSGWPSFTEPADPDHVARIEDHSHGMTRTEIVCARCTAHLGHVFPDGPPPTHERHCLNSVSLEFFAEGDDLPVRSRPPTTDTAYFAAGCFWGVEDRFQNIDGVIDATSGYQGGASENPTYRQVCSGDTGHAESVRVIYDPARVGYEALLAAFFGMHDPTQRDRQGPDVGSQYRSAIFTTSDAQLDAARAFVSRLTGTDRFAGRQIVTQIEPAPEFHEAEEAHQDYNAKHGRSCGIG